VRLSTIDDRSADGRLAVIGADHATAVLAGDAFPTLQSALERWDEALPYLQHLSAALAAGDAAGAFAYDPAQSRAPLPRAWQWLDGSVYLSHSMLIAEAYGQSNPLWERPLMYQGMSHQFLGPLEDVPLPSEDDGIDFEGEFGIITDFVPMGTTKEQARDHIKLLVQINDWSLRTIASREMETGFGWVRGKPACSVAPLALTPDELGDKWANARVHLNLDIAWNGARFGNANGGEMAFGFDELIAHAAQTRSLCAGTMIGSGTVSNATYREVGSSCIAEKRGIEVLDHGAPQTAFMRFGDEVRMRAIGADGSFPFGEIHQKVVKSGA